MPHRQRLLKDSLDEKFKDEKDNLRLVFVCAMWITGFDVPTCSTIYLDKPMRAHTLMQTIARANRVAPGKESGLIVDYVGIFRALQDALATYSRPEGQGGGSPILDKAELVDLAEKFQKLIDVYNAGSQNVEAFFKELKDFAGALTAEEQRALAEGLSEEELALFDILTKPEPILSKAEEAQVKKVCKELLATLKREKLVLDWREKQQARAAVMQTLKLELRRLPGQYTKDIRTEKMARAYAHLYDHYYGAGTNAYQSAASR